MPETLRVGVIGGGLIAQAVHLPNLAAMPDRFTIAAIADPSQRVRDALAALYRARVHADWQQLIDGERLDAVVVCSPHSTHAAVIAAALDRGFDVFVEKPLCISQADADAICGRTAATGRVVQVGYMKRFSRGYEAFLDSLPESSEGLRLIDVITHDPWMAREPFVPWSRMTAATDVPDAVTAATAEDERRQVADAVGADDDETVRAFSYTFLACLVHDINLVHGALERLGLAGRAEAHGSDAWAHGDAAAGSLVLPDGAVWRTSWMLLRGLMEFEERARLYFDDSIHELTFGVPYHSEVPVRHGVRSAARGAAQCHERAFVDDAYVAELKHFHACVTEGAQCQTPPEQARDDIAVLRDLFLVRRRTPSETHPTP